MCTDRCSRIALLGCLVLTTARLDGAAADELAPKPPEAVFEVVETTDDVVRPVSDVGLVPDECVHVCDPCDPVGCDDCCDRRDRLFGVVARSDRCFDGFVSPITNPVFFEDPRTVSELRPIFINHVVPGNAGGGSVQLYALQIRAALTDRLSVIATKDGFVVSSNALIDDGFADVYAGLKYNLAKDPCGEWLVSAGASYELPVGSPRAFQGRGDGEFHLFLTGGAELAEDWHWLSGSGFRLPTNTNKSSQMWYWSNHLDRRLNDHLYGLVELNWYHWMRSGTNGVPGVEGGDLFNFGSTGVAGNDIVTFAVGAKLKPTELMEVGVAWEFPLTNREDVMDNRLTVDWIVRF